MFPQGLLYKHSVLQRAFHINYHHDREILWRKSVELQIHKISSMWVAFPMFLFWVKLDLKQKLNSMYFLKKTSTLQVSTKDTRMWVHMTSNWLCIIYVVEQNAKVTLTTDLIFTHKSKSKTTETLEGTHAKLAWLWFNDIQSPFENWGLLPAQ